MKLIQLLPIAAALTLAACSHIGITPGQGAALAGQAYDQWAAMKLANQTAAKVAVDVQPAPEPESPGWLQGAMMLFGLWK